MKVLGSVVRNGPFGLARTDTQIIRVGSIVAALLLPVTPLSSI